MISTLSLELFCTVSMRNVSLNKLPSNVCECLYHHYQTGLLFATFITSVAEYCTCTPVHECVSCIRIYAIRWCTGPCTQQCKRLQKCEFMYYVRVESCVRNNIPTM